MQLKQIVLGVREGCDAAVRTHVAARKVASPSRSIRCANAATSTASNTITLPRAPVAASDRELNANETCPALN